MARDEFLFVLIAQTIGLAIFTSIMLQLADQCAVKWDATSMLAIRWDPLRGCLCQLPDGGWWPVSRLKEIEIPEADWGQPKDFARERAIEYEAAATFAYGPNHRKH